MRGYRTIEQVEGYIQGRIHELERIDNGQSAIKKEALWEVLYYLQGDDDNC